MYRLHCVLNTDPGDPQLLDVIETALDEMDKTLGIGLYYAFYQEGGEGLGRHVYEEMDKRAILSLVEDFLLPVSYLIIEAPKREIVESISQLLSEYLPFVSLEELQQAAIRNIVDKPKALVRMALGAGDQADSVSVEIIRDALRSEDELVRFRAAEAASLTQWPEFLADLPPLVQGDSSPEVREMARRAVEACQRRLGSVSGNGSRT